MSDAKRTSRLPSLDGLRAMSIGLVLIAHLANQPGLIPLPTRVLVLLAALGVRVFFVISGFLITTLLLAERDRSGSISLRSFYLRRTMRIFPPGSDGYVAVMAIAAAAGWIHLRPHDLLAAVTYTVNYHHDRSWYLGHAWSLAVEEQFYLLWPFVFSYLGARRAALVALAMMVVSPLLRVTLLISSRRPSRRHRRDVPHGGGCHRHRVLARLFPRGLRHVGRRWLTHLQSPRGWPFLWRVWWRRSPRGRRWGFWSDKPSPTSASPCSSNVWSGFQPAASLRSSTCAPSCTSER